MRVVVWGSEASRARAVAEGHDAAESRDALFEAADVLSLHLRLAEGTRGIVSVPPAGTRYDGGPDEGTRGPAR